MDALPAAALTGAGCLQRDGLRVAQACLEAHGCVVDVAESGNDHDARRGFMVDFARADERAGAAVARIQVECARRRVPSRDWTLRVIPADRRYWSASLVPIIGVLWDPETGAMRWTNLTARARGPHEFPADVIRFAADDRLTDASVPALIESARKQLRPWTAMPLLHLVEAFDDQRALVVDDCWALGRSDPRALLLLRRVLPALRGESARRGIVVLSRLCPDTDLRCRGDDWVPEAVKRQLLATCRWTPSEIYELVAAVEQRFEGTPGWEPGGLGHRLWCLLVQDPDLSTKTLSAIGSALDDNDLASAMRLLVIHQYSACDPAEAAEQALIQYPAIFRHPRTSQLRAQITANGFVPVF